MFLLKKINGNQVLLIFNILDIFFFQALTATAKK